MPLFGLAFQELTSDTMSYTTHVWRDIIIMRFYNTDYIIDNLYF